MRTKFAIFMAVAWLLVGGGAAAVAFGQGAAGGGETARDALASGLTPAPMMAEIKAVLDSARLVEAELRSDLDRAARGEAAERIRNRLATHQVALKIKILEIQAHHVRAEGREELARLIEARLASFRDNRSPIARATATD
jgi:hypothetical protein